ncbi:hypothetical protein BDD43_3754 [Mucilaginibacter gracilis]|uniref:Outer membrane protein with beta-barrel domain n=1 Tax=Mucilaginibacter gracilis TaxID=423350 RepID=A0A495J5A6_9SPHI|nr:hypothetical protein [Mucilaginibacter gracilis]RKR83544.1 hypothetical protein BDD43_3754 [Mucilaginibacter gracilis]
MKLSLKLALIATTLLLINIKVNAQTTAAKTFGLSLGLEPGLPTTTQSTYTAFTLGGTIRLQYGITNNLSATFTTGGYHFFSKTIPGTDIRYGSFGVGPVKAGLKEFFIPNFYINAEAGVGVEVTQQGFSGGQKKLLLSPGFGYGDKHWDVGFHFESLTGQQNNYGIFGLRIAYGFKL